MCIIGEAFTASPCCVLAHVRLIPCMRLTQLFRRVTEVPEGFGVPPGLVQVLISPQVKVNKWAVRMSLPANNCLCYDRRSQTRGRLGHP